MIGAAVDEGVLERHLRGRVVSPVVRGRPEHPVRSDGCFDVIAVDGEREGRPQQLEGLVATSFPARLEALAAQATRLDIRPPGTPCRHERSIEDALKL